MHPLWTDHVNSKINKVGISKNTVYYKEMSNVAVYCILTFLLVSIPPSFFNAHI